MLHQRSQSLSLLQLLPQAQLAVPQQLLQTPWRAMQSLPQLAGSAVVDSLILHPQCP